LASSINEDVRIAFAAGRRENQKAVRRDRVVERGGAAFRRHLHRVTEHGEASGFAFCGLGRSARCDEKISGLMIRRLLGRHRSIRSTYRSRAQLIARCCARHDELGEVVSAVGQKAAGGSRCRFWIEDGARQRARHAQITHAICGRCCCRSVGRWRRCGGRSTRGERGDQDWKEKCFSKRTSHLTFLAKFGSIRNRAATQAVPTETCRVHLMTARRCRAQRSVDRSSRL
jgi:hypothetical protein